MERWESLFADLGDSFMALEAQELAELLQEQIRAESAQLRMWQRCAGAVGQQTEVETTSGNPLQGKIVAAAPQWVLLSASGRQVLVPLNSVISLGALRGVASPAGSEQSGPAQQAPGRSGTEVTLNRALRTLSRDRQRVTVVAGSKQFTGVIGSVCGDHIVVIAGGSGEWEQRRATKSVIVATAHISYLYG